MKLFFALLPFCLAMLPFAVAAQTDAEVVARASALELAGAFANDGFKLRDGHYTCTVPPGEPKLIAVNLYAGNDYWFIGGTGTTTGKISMELLDDKGSPLPAESYNTPGRTASGLSAARTGLHYVRIIVEESEPAAVCFIYSYR